MITGKHQLTLFLLDYNNARYAETITIKDAVNHTVLDTRTATAFHTGVYYVYNVSGSVTITLSSTAGHFAVVAASFSAPAQAAPIL